LPVVEDKTFGCMIEGVFVMEDALLQVVDAVIAVLLGNGCIGFAVSDGL
jgi:hypothetical protein